MTTLYERAIALLDAPLTVGLPYEVAMVKLVQLQPEMYLDGNPPLTRAELIEAMVEALKSIPLATAA